MIERDYVNKGVSLSGIGGVETGADAAEFILLGSDTVQVRAIHFWRYVRYTFVGVFSSPVWVHS